MKISLLNEWITIQKVVVEVDEICNHLSHWADFYKVYATINKEAPFEVTSARRVCGMDFTIRYSSELKDLTSKGHRVLFRGNIYEIKSIDHMNYRKNLWNCTVKGGDMTKTNINNLESEVMNDLETYKKKTTNVAKKAVTLVSEQARKEIKSESPKNRGIYSKD